MIPTLENNETDNKYLYLKIIREGNVKINEGRRTMQKLN